MRLTVADLMNEHPVVVSPDCSADDAVEILSRHEACELYVTDKLGRLLGIVPDYELLKVELSGDAHDASVEQLMCRNIPVFTPNSDAAEVAKLFRDGRYRQFPVVSRGRLLGVITRGDVVRLMAVLRRIDSPAPRTPESIKKPRIAAAPGPRKRSRPGSVASVTPTRRRRAAPRALRDSTR